MPPEPIPSYLNALSIVSGTLGVFYAIQMFLPRPNQVLRQILLAILYGVVVGVALYCLNVLTNAFYTHILTRVYGFPITSFTLGIYAGVIGFIVAYSITHFFPIRQQEWAKGTLLGSALLTACLSVVSSLFAFDVINLKFHWFSGFLAITIGAAFVLTNAIIRFIQQYTRSANRQEFRRELQRLAEAQAEKAELFEDEEDLLDDDEDPIEDDEENSLEDDEEPSARRFRPPVRKQANLPTRLYGAGRFFIGIIVFYASVSLFGFRVVLYPLALILALIAALLAVLALQRRVVARLPKSGVAIVSAVLVMIAIASQIFRAI